MNEQEEKALWRAICDWRDECLGEDEVTNLVNSIIKSHETKERLEAVKTT